MLRALILLYCIGLFVFYMFLSFDKWHSVPNWVYYMWDKSVSAGFFIWLLLYKTVRFDNRKLVAPIVFFSLIRLIFDVVGFFGGPTASNEYRVAALFCFLLTVFYVLTLRRNNIFNKWLSKLFINRLTNV